jgi:hypothetical protein
MTDGTESALERQSGFKWGDVSRRTTGGALRVAQAAAQQEPPLGPLESFNGTFTGNGFNTIFRPQDIAASPTQLPVQPPASDPTDNILELNLTTEKLDFSESLGSIPNRGAVQGDAFLNGVPYLQTISDITDPANPIGIHFEPGVWLSVPDTTKPAEGPTLVRMASIPHGTTIEAQGTSFNINGAPPIPPLDITPFVIGNPGQKITFRSQTATESNTFRIPQDLGPFIAAGTITQDILTDPNKVLRDQIASQNISSTTTIVVKTKPDLPLFGGGTDNIALLKGDPNSADPNADAVQMTAVFWIETVCADITIPPCTPGSPVTVQPEGTGPLPSFLVDPPHEITEETKISVTYPQIQYSQVVFLNFKGLTWPHASVATLVPQAPIPVEQAAMAQGVSVPEPAKVPEPVTP